MQMTNLLRVRLVPPTPTEATPHRRMETINRRRKRDGCFKRTVYQGKLAIYIGLPSYLLGKVYQSSGAYQVITYQQNLGIGILKICLLTFKNLLRVLYILR